MSDTQANDTFSFGKTVKNQVEHRLDPLTLQETRINPARATRPKQGEHPSLDSQFQEIVKSSQERCPFCPERILEKVPKFPETLAGHKDGRYIKGETILFPNLNPFGENHAVGVISSSHFVDIDQYAPQQLKNTILTAQEYIRAVFTRNNADKYAVLVWNYLPPSAGSILHPHIQMLVETEAVPEMRKHLARSEEYYQRQKTNYFEDLVKAEQQKRERYIGGNEHIQVLATFAPRGNNEMQFIFKGVSNLAALSEAQIDAFVDLLLRALKGYGSMGIGSFNLVSYSGPTNENRSDYSLNFRLFSRPAPKGCYTNDTGPMERMYDSFVIDTVPERLTETMAPFFQ